jgi:hypothetical protein
MGNAPYTPPLPSHLHSPGSYIDGQILVQSAAVDRCSPILPILQTVDNILSYNVYTYTIIMN